MGLQGSSPDINRTKVALRAFADACAARANCRSASTVAGRLRRVPWQPCVSLRKFVVVQRSHQFKPAAILNGKHAAGISPGNPTKPSSYRWSCNNQPPLFKEPFCKCVLERPLGKWTDDFCAAGPKLGHALLDQFRWNGSLWRIGARLRTGIFLRAGGLHWRRRLGSRGSDRTTN